MKDSLQIKEALELSAKEITMDEAVAKETLLKALKAADMSTNIAFTPVVGAAVLANPKINFSNLIAGTAAGAAVLTLAGYNPTIDKVSFNDAMTNKALSVNVTLSTTFGVDQVFAQNEAGQKYYGTLENGSYIIDVDNNGSYKICVLSDTGQKVESSIVVTNIDKLGPTVASYELAGDTLSVTYEDDKSLVDISTAYAIESGNKIMPTSVDSATNTVTFAYSGTNLNIYVKDSLGNESNYLIEK